MSSSPSPYVPRIVEKFVGGPIDDKTRPWLALRTGESSSDWHRRVSRTCWCCGWTRADVTQAALGEHESTCGGRKK